VGASIGWTRGAYTVVGDADNLTDTTTPICINPANFSFNRYATLRPLTVGVRLGARY